MKGIIFDVQRFSVHDGPGIRTTVFMKGCPLSCAWCHNPEGLSKSLQVQFYENECINCGTCSGKTFDDAEKCPTGALKVCGKEIDEEELFAEILKDKIYYGENGGVTFSGGECLMQVEFVVKMLELCKNESIGTAVDTSGFAPWKAFELTLENCDLYLYDIKMTDKEKHKDFTGVDNTLILENLVKLDSLNKPIWIRVPVIPDVNDTLQEMTDISNFVSKLKNVEQVTLMPYHVLGKSKYETLGLTCKYNTTDKITQEQLEEFNKLFS